MSLQEKISELAQSLGVIGVSAAVLHDGVEEYAYYGVTSRENPLTVDENTLFQFGSTGKTYTATAIMRLVEQGKIDLDAPVKKYLPEFTLKDAEVAESVTVLQLLNHTAGWEGDLMEDTGPGDDALVKYVERMADLEQTNQPGQVVSYNNAALSVAGLIIARIHGTTYEQAINELVLRPLGLNNTWWFPNDIMSRRFAVGHRVGEDGKVTIARPWALPRGNAPAGGMSADARDQLAWAKFHLGDGTAADGTRALEEKTLKSMQEPTISMAGSALGHFVGISWLLRDIEGVRLVGHGGTTNGQYSEFVMVPERGFALISMTNSGPNGSQLNTELEKWALEHYLGITEPEPVPMDAPAEVLDEYVGRYETVAVIAELTRDGGRLLVNVEVKPEMAAALQEAGEEPEDSPPIPIALIEGRPDQFIVPEGPAKGMLGYFVRDVGGPVTGAHIGGRLATRVGDLTPA